VLLEAELPPGGYAVFTATAGKPTPSPKSQDRFGNDDVTLVFDRGLLVRCETSEGIIINGDYRRPIHDLAFLRYDQSGVLHVGALIGEERFQPKDFCVEESGPLRWVHRAEGFVSRHPATIRTMIYKNSPRVEFHTRIECKGDGGLFVARFPVPPGTQLWGDIPFGVEMKDLSQEVYGELPDVPSWMGCERLRPRQFYAQSWVDAQHTEGSRALISLDGDKWWILQDNENLLGHILFAAFDEPAHWEVNINEQIRAIGQHDFRYALLPHRGDWRSANLPEVSRLLRNPAFSFMRTRHGSKGELPSSCSLLELTPPCVQLSALVPEKEGWLARLVNLSDNSVGASLTFPVNIRSAQVVDLLGNPMPAEGLRCEGAKVMLTMGAWKIVNLHLEPQPPKR